MLTNYLKITFRALTRHKGYTIINILGLAIGISCSLLITLFVFHELSYDLFHSKSKQIYRFYLQGKIEGQEMRGVWTPAPLAFTVKELFPEVEDVTRFIDGSESMIKYEDRSFIEKNILWADSTFFKVFSFQMLKGNPATALVAPKSMVITQEMAAKYFGNENPLDKLVKVNNDTTLFRVTGVIENIPKNSHFKFDFLFSMATLPRSKDQEWLSNSFYTYIVLNPKISVKDFESKIDTMVKNRISPMLKKYLNISVDEFLAKGNRYGYALQSLTGMHLDTSVSQGISVVSDVKYIYIFSIIAIFIIIIACINFMNLATARSANRAKEVGIRKVVGSNKNKLIFQFLTESILLTTISLVIAIVIVQLVLPLYNNLLELNLETEYIKRWYLLPVMFMFSVLVGVLAGIYPSFFLASFKPIEVLKGKLKAGAKGKLIRSILVIFQFFITIVIFIGTFIIYQQLQYMISKDLGFSKEQLIVVPRATALHNQQEAFKTEILKNTAVTDITFSSAVPSYFNNNNGYQIEGEDKSKTVIIWTTWCDENFAKTYNLKMAEGRFFSKDMASDSIAVVINERAVKKFGFTKPLQTRLIKPTDDNKGQILNVIGVVKDFHFQKLNSVIEPALFILQKPQRLNYISIKINTQNASQTIKNIEKVWKDFTMQQPFEYFFMDERYAHLYSEEQRTQRLTLVFTLLSIFIACLGLFGLISFIIEKRSKEIGIRKALGASVPGLFSLLSKEIVYLIIFSSILAWPVSYLIMNDWLQNFAYHIDINYFIFLFSSLIVGLVAILTISYQVYKATKVNPSVILKYE